MAPLEHAGWSSNDCGEVVNGLSGTAFRQEMIGDTRNRRSSSVVVLCRRKSMTSTRDLIRMRRLYEVNQDTGTVSY